MIEIVGHRGASYDAPENTLPSVQLGFEQGADAVDVDVFATSDGRVVAIHDADTERVASVKLDVAKSTLAELKQLDVGAWKGARWKGTTIPTLEEVLELVPEGRRLLIEVKCEKRALSDLERAIDASGKRSQVVLISFGYPVIRKSKQRMSDIPAYWIYGFGLGERARWGNPSLDGLIRRVEKAGLDGLDLEGEGPFDRAFVDQLTARGMDLYTWTVNDPKRARELIEMGVRGITTDRPGYMREQLGF
jgi:glycerophosphoryl diester phosphodiesterase